MASILVVDDRAENREFLVTLLGYRNYRVLEARDGNQALELARRERPDLVITDILMPAMDGYELVRRLRGESALASTQVIFYTAHFLRSEAEKLARALSVAHILTKPSEPEAVLNVVADALGAGALPPQGTQKLAGFVDEHVRVMTDKLAATVDELSVANERLHALIDVNLELASQREPQALLDSVCRHARNLVAARCAMIAVTHTENGRTVTLKATAGISDPRRARFGAPGFQHGLTGRAYRERESGRVSRVDDPPATFGLPDAYPPFRSLLVAPVSSLSRTYGWIALSDKVGAEQFGAEHERLIGMLAAEVGRIYENAHLYNELLAQTERLQAQIAERAAAEEKVRRLNRVYALLSGVNTLIVRVRSREELFTDACRIAVEHGSFAIAWIAQLTDEHAGAIPVAWAGTDAGEYLAASREPEATHRPGVMSRAITSGRLAYINDLAAEPPDSLGPRRREALRRGYRSVVALPLMIGSRTVGVMTLLAHEPDFFNDEELKLLGELGGDISFALDHLEKEAKLDYLAFYDSLTGLPNRTLFQDRVNRMLNVTREQGTQLALVLGNIKRFRHVNESFGTHAGDALLREVAKRMLTICRADKLARVGADVFGGFIAPIASAADAAHTLKKVADVFRRAVDFAGQSLSIDVVAGIAIAPVDGADADTLFRNAEAALKQAKLSGEAYLFYQSAMNASVTETLLMESRLRQAVDREEFVLHYQPKYSLSSGKISGMEALIRWNDPGDAVVPPTRFVPLLEETGLILKTGRWAISRALEDHQRWRERGLNPPRISVNVSPVQLRHKDFVEDVRAALANCASGADALDLELTESVLMEDIATNVGKLAAIREMGVHISVDDFGTGYSSLSYLAKLPVNELKIDRSFVITMTGSPESMAIVSTILSLARALGLQVVAEGVETEEQSRLLKLLRCDEAQGYLFSKPVPSAEIAALLEQQPTRH
jgi:diguanylate cyclase (GGDEF)-like protein